MFRVRGMKRPNPIPVTPLGLCARCQRLILPPTSTARYCSQDCRQAFEHRQHCYELDMQRYYRVHPERRSASYRQASLFPQASQTLSFWEEPSSS